MEIPSLAPHCPWYKLSEIAKPNVKWCEATQCSWITEPANTWSNLAFVIVGLIIWQMAKRKNQETLRLFGPTAIFLGACSFVYHMSYTMVLQAFDFIGMFAFIGIILILNLRRLELLSKEKQVKAFIGGVLGLTALFLIFYVTKIPMQIIVAVLVLLVVISEIKARKAAANSPSPANFIKAIAFLGVALTFTLLDVTRTWCNPSNHFIQGHALWHVFNSVVIYYLYRYYEQFDLDNTGPETKA